MPKRLPVHGLDPDGNADGRVVGISGGKPAWIDGGGSSSGLAEFDVVDYGALVDGSTDDTTAWQAAITAAGTAGGGWVTSSKNGVSVIGGALQDTSGANAQLLIPAIAAVGSENITIVLGGILPPPVDVSVIGSTPLPDNHLVLKSTLTSGSGGALLGGSGSAGTTNFTNVDLRLANVSFRMPSNPTHTALDLRHAANVDLDHVAVDCGSYYVQGLTQPTTSTSYGIRLPAVGNGAHVRLGEVDVIGFYNGYEINEHTIGGYVAAWGCLRAAVFTSAYHASTFTRLMAVHCTKGIVFTGGEHRVDVWQFDVEHAATGWWVTTYDIDDASNFGKGFVRWHVVLAGVGIDSTFTVNSATGIQTSRVGSTIGGGSSLTVKDEGSTLTSAATSFDFMGSGVTATNTGGAVTVTIPGATSTTGELVMQDGVTAPPAPIENEAQDDWLYAD